MTGSNSHGLTRETEEFSPFVVFGASKSGTTWVQQLLDSHPQVRCHFQVPIFPLRNRALFHPATGAYNAGLSPFEGVFKDKRDEAFYNLTLKFVDNMNVLRSDFVAQFTNGAAAEETADISTLHARVMRGIVRDLLCDTKDKSIFGTKAYTDLELLFHVFSNAKLIHVLRDGRDVCVSKRFHTLRMKVFYLGDERSEALRILNSWRPTRSLVYRLRRQFGWFGEEWFRFPTDKRPLFHPHILTKVAMDWTLIVRYLLKQQDAHPNNVITVRYEDLIANPEPQVKRMLAFLGADSAYPILRDVIDKTSFAKLQGGKDGGFFRKGQTGDWRNYFTSADIGLFKEVAGDILIELGYESNNQWTV